MKAICWVIAVMFSVMIYINLDKVETAKSTHGTLELSLKRVHNDTAIVLRIFAPLSLRLLHVSNHHVLFIIKHRLIATTTACTYAASSSTTTAGCAVIQFL